MTANRRPSQRDRVLRALRIRGRTGITQADFLGPDTFDGGKPILRLPARIDEVRQSGYVIDSSARRSQMAVYVLVAEPAAQTAAPTATNASAQESIGPALSPPSPLSPPHEHGARPSAFDPWSDFA